MHRWTDDELLRSVHRVGFLLPVIYRADTGDLIDGRRRLRIMRLCSDEPRVLTLPPREAAAALFAVHPDRALELFPAETSEAGADLYCAERGTVARAMRATQKSVGSKPRQRASDRVRHVLRCNRALALVREQLEGQRPLDLEEIERALLGDL